MEQWYLRPTLADRPDGAALAKAGAVGTQPSPGFAPARISLGHVAPEPRRVIHPPQVHELVHDDVVAHPVGHEDQTPVQADAPVPPAGAPAGPLIADGHLRDVQTEPGR